MIGPIDRLIRFFLKNHLHRRRKAIINNALSRFKTHYPDACVEDILELKGRFKFEAIRIYKVVDQAILEANLKRARYIFWFMAVFSTLWGIYGGFSGEIISSYFSPLVMASLAWFVSWATIPILYNGRITGAMNSITAVFVHENSFIKRSKQLSNNALILEEIASDDPHSTVILIRNLQQDNTIEISNKGSNTFEPARCCLAVSSNTPLFTPKNLPNHVPPSDYGTFPQ